jgi:hypothetical protein
LPKMKIPWGSSGPCPAPITPLLPPGLVSQPALFDKVPVAAEKEKIPVRADKGPGPFPAPPPLACPS